VGRAAEILAEACAERGRDPGEISRSMRIFTRVGQLAEPAAALAEYRHLNPWFSAIPDAEIREALVLGSPRRCRERLAQMVRNLRLDLPILDLCGLRGEAAAELLEALAP
jgi:alkanesulfonate monooxygenase SsuD/methylene tetrahydromethanopterin reductase-like flavin-dependent oxidoreductase (luciferase family)